MGFSSGKIHFGALFFVFTDYWFSGGIRSPYTPSKVDIHLLKATKQMDIYPAKKIANCTEKNTNHAIQLKPKIIFVIIVWL